MNLNAGNAKQRESTGREFIHGVTLESSEKWSSPRKDLSTVGSKKPGKVIVKLSLARACDSRKTSDDDLALSPE
jgi:hypothetical protein